MVNSNEQSFREALARIAAGFYTEKGAENHAKDILRLADAAELCDVCQGSGETVFNKHGGDPAYDDAKQCAECGGSGRTPSGSSPP